MRDLHARMLDAVLGGDGLRGVAELAASEAGAPVAIVLPARGLAHIAPSADGLEGLIEHVERSINGRNGARPAGIDVEVAVKAGDERVGSVLLLAGDEAALAVDREEVLRMAALAALTEVAVSDARAEVEQNLRGSLIEDLRAGRLDGEEAVRRAGRFGCDLSAGGVALVADVNSPRPRHAAALVVGEYRGAMAELVDGRVYAILPARAGDEPGEAVLEAAGRIAARLRSHGPAGVSSFYPDPSELHRAIEEAELVMEVIAHNAGLAGQLERGVANGVYRLLFRALVSNPDEVRRFYEDTVEPIVAYDLQYRSELLATLESYLESDCNMNATARATFTHRHTVAYRLDRVHELTGLNPSVSEDRERLGLGVKAYRIIGPTLPR